MGDSSAAVSIITQPQCRPSDIKNEVSISPKIPVTEV